MIEIHQELGLILGVSSADSLEKRSEVEKVDNKLRSKEADLIKLRNKIKAQKEQNQTASSSTSSTPASNPPVQRESGSNNNDNKQSKEQEAANLFAALEKASGKKLLIAIKGYPDPDNIACALTLQWFAGHYNISSTIVHFEEISHHENRALVKKLDLELERWNPDFDITKYDYFAINDSQSPELPIKLPPTCELLVFVDHHRTLGTVKGHFVDIREHVGSTSAIYIEYLMNSPVTFSGETPEETKIATALMHGIRSDTDNFVNATPHDFRASEFIAKYLDKDLLSLISRQSIPAKTMDLTQIALQRKDIRSNFMFCGVGYVRDEDRDGIGQCADYLLNREGIETVVVYGVVGNEFIDGSLRTKSHILDPDKWLKDVFGQDKNGLYYGGGRKDKGGFQIPLGVLTKCPDKELLWILIKKTIDELFYEKIGVEGKANSDGEGN
jgi:nanoRNase/pAp phosphatase (c-di-AMP/oligoRNAs hydrolase)